VELVALVASLVASMGSNQWIGVGSVREWPSRSTRMGRTRAYGRNAEHVQRQYRPDSE